VAGFAGDYDESSCLTTDGNFSNSCIIVLCPGKTHY